MRRAVRQGVCRDGHAGQRSVSLRLGEGEDHGGCVVGERGWPRTSTAATKRCP